MNTNTIKVFGNGSDHGTPFRYGGFTEASRAASRSGHFRTRGTCLKKRKDIFEMVAEKKGGRLATPP